MANLSIEETVMNVIGKVTLPLRDPFLQFEEQEHSLPAHRLTAYEKKRSHIKTNLFDRPPPPTTEAAGCVQELQRKSSGVGYGGGIIFHWRINEKGLNTILPISAEFHDIDVYPGTRTKHIKFKLS